MSDKNIAPSGPEDGEGDGILLGIARTLLENIHWGIPWLIALSILSEWCVDSIKGLLGMALGEYSLLYDGVLTLVLFVLWALVLDWIYSRKRRLD